MVSLVSKVSKVSMVAMDSKDERYNCYKCHGFYRLTHRYFVCSTKKKVLHEKLGDWGMGIEGEHPSLGPLWLFGRLGPTGPLGLLKTVETMEGVRGS